MPKLLTLKYIYFTCICSYVVDPKAYCFTFNSGSQKYETCASWDKLNVDFVFGSNMPKSGNCFLGVDETHGYMFDEMDVIYSDGGTWDMKDSDPTNPFYMENPGNTVEACTETQDPNFFLFFEAEKMYIYDATKREGTYIGKCCMSS